MDYAGTFKMYVVIEHSVSGAPKMAPIALFICRSPPPAVGGYILASCGIDTSCAECCEAAEGCVLAPSPPWKWPLTYAERIQELTTTKNEPNHAPRYDNIDAAIRYQPYHMSFTNQDQLDCLVSGRKTSQCAIPKW